MASLPSLLAEVADKEPSLASALILGLWITGGCFALSLWGKWGAVVACVVALVWLDMTFAWFGAPGIQAEIELTLGSLYLRLRELLAVLPTLGVVLGMLWKRLRMSKAQPVAHANAGRASGS